jgi:hypothetical protein
MMQATVKCCAQSLAKAPAASTAALQRGFASSKPETPKEPQPEEQATDDANSTNTKGTKESKPSSTHKTMAELDEEMKMKMSGLSGDGGESGVEYEDGKPVAMKRSVKNNMFRYI